METLVAPEKKGIEVVLHRKEFLPVNDEYRPFKIVSRRDRWMENYEVPLCVKALGLPKNKRILEVGCGAGFGLVSLSKYCLPVKLVGIDIDPYLLSLAEKKLVEQNVYAELRQEDVRNMPFPDESFDIIVDFGTNYHINRRVRALNEITRVLAKGGIYVCETPLNQLISHPFRSISKRIPWQKAPQLKANRSALMWNSRVKAS